MSSIICKLDQKQRQKSSGSKRHASLLQVLNDEEHDSVYISFDKQISTHCCRSSAKQKSSPPITLTGIANNSVTNPPLIWNTAYFKITKKAQSVLAFSPKSNWEKQDLRIIGLRSRNRIPTPQSRLSDYGSTMRTFVISVSLYRRRRQRYVRLQLLSENF